MQRSAILPSAGRPKRRSATTKHSFLRPNGFKNGCCRTGRRMYPGSTLRECPTRRSSPVATRSTTWTLNDGSLGLAIGDVAGHGFAPALIMASTHAYLRSMVRTGSDVGEILTRINAILCG